MQVQDGRQCPRCRRDVGLMPLLGLSLPKRVRCPHCKAESQYEDMAMVWTSMLLVLMVLSVSALVLAMKFGSTDRPFVDFPRQMLMFIGAVSVGWIVVSVAGASYARANKPLRLDDEKPGQRW